MNRIDATFQKLQEQGRKALIPFVTAGDAGLDTTEQLVLQLEASGADIIELGVPFSDPIAEGPVIQEAMGRNWLIFSIWSNACGKRRRFLFC